MRKAKQEITDPDVLEEIVSGAMICRLAMVDNGLPYLLPFNYGYRDGCIYIHSAPEGKKIDLILKNPLVCFEIEDTVRIIRDEKACKWATLYRSVIGYGRVDIISDTENKKDGLGVLMAQHGAPHLSEFTDKEVSNMVILKLSIESMTGKQSSNWDSHFSKESSKKR
jgi:nitroimidazol reductase NimA-like FMN-containing flavoprotein (pyridoxamine 5'-phosphate oxidase superfamily)